MFDQVMTDATLYKYSTFWPRFCAGFVDGLAMLPVTIAIAGWSLTAGPRTLALLYVVSGALPIAYSVTLHGLFGQTLGKMALRVKVLTLEETPISVRHALLRDSPWIVLTVLGSIGAVRLALAGGRPFDPNVHTVGDTLLNGAGFLWFLAEVVTMLFNAKRRALHDWIAGTVVVRV